MDIGLWLQVSISVLYTGTLRNTAFRMTITVPLTTYTNQQSADQQSAGPDVGRASARVAPTVQARGEPVYRRVVPCVRAANERAAEFVHEMLETVSL